VKVNHAVPVPTGVLPKFWLDGVSVTVCAMSAKGVSSETARRVRMRLQNKLIGMLLLCHLQIFGWGMMPKECGPTGPQLGDERMRSPDDDWAEAVEENLLIYSTSSQVIRNQAYYSIALQ
jgi:hypothetical protein